MNSFDSSAIAEAVVAEQLLDEPPHTVVVYDCGQLKNRIDTLVAAFPPHTLHALAIKACPITALLRRTKELGCGAEVASRAELAQALRIAFQPDRIVFDSPAKTTDELRYALLQGVHINVDNLDEIDRIAGLLDAKSPQLSIGVRVNPGLRAGDIEATSTAVPGAKFGVSLDDAADELLERFRRLPWLTGLHVHVGSQGCELGLLTDGVARTVEFAERIESEVESGRIRTLDIGGGLAVAYHIGERKPDFSEYASALRQQVPALFSRRWRLVTEFGRAIWASSGCVLSRVEYTKVSHGRRIAVVHTGADMFTRAAYVPDKWYHEVTVFDARGRQKQSEVVPQDVAGPLCFSGDLVARSRSLPLIEAGDFVLIHDAGAYTLSMWSRYNSRQSPAVYGYSRGEPGLMLLRRRESLFDVMRFWD